MNCKTTPHEGCYQNQNSFDFDYLMEEIDNVALAMTYVPMQPWEEPYELEKGLNSGTIFPGLDLPFLGGGCR